jgi:hypothetical protein
MRAKSRQILVALLMSTLPGAAGATTFTVTSTADSGTGSLRDAITAANANAGPHEIHFAIPGGGVQTIILLTDLPPITEAVTIDGYTQAGASPNGNGPGLGLNTVLRVELQPGPFPPPTFGLRFQAPDCHVRGVGFNGFRVTIVAGPSADRTQVQGCFVGTDPLGMTVTGFTQTGILVLDSSDCLIGGEAPEARNLISGAGEANIWLSTGSGHRIQGNLIGTDALGVRSLQPDTGLQRGVQAFAVTDSLIGGMSAAAGNVISGTRTAVLIGDCDVPASAAGNQILHNLMGTDVTGRRSIGLPGFGPIRACGDQTTIGLPGAGNVIAGNSNGNGVIVGGAGSIIQGNKIGTDVDGVSPRGHDFHGLVVIAPDVVVGGIGPGEGNLIAYNGASGIFVGDVTGVRIRGNSVHSNLGFGLILNHAGPAIPNDPGDGDTGSNNRQNFPVLDSFVSIGGTTNVIGTLDSAESTPFDIDFYSNPCPPQDGVLEGGTYMGSATVATDALGHASFDVVLPIGLAVGEVVSATATDPGGNTSEFSQSRRLFSVWNTFAFGSGGFGKDAGGEPMTLYGDFQAPVVAVRIGSVPATNVIHVDETQIWATSPALPAGTTNLVEVEDSNGRVLTLSRGWVSMFQDVPVTDPYALGVWRLLAAEITAGCAPGLFCLNAPVTRAQMAVFLLRGARGICYSPPPATGTVFGDVAADSFAAAWIEALAIAGITAGCGGGNYCPDAAITREQMAVFLIRAFHEQPYTPPSCLVPRFSDVPCSSIYSAWVEEIAARRTTAGCGGSLYCPTDSVTRWQMAVFLTAAFFLTP